MLSTPWGSSGTWGQRSLVSAFHQEVRSGERFFDVLKQMCANPGRFLPVIELMYICMSLGFMGRYRLSRRGVGDISRIREETYAVIARQRKPAEPALAPHTKGVNAPYRPARFVVPLWVAAAAGLGVIGGLFLWFSIGLNAESDTVYARLQGAPPDRMPTITRTPVVEPAPVIAVATAAARAVDARQAAPVPEARDRSEARRGARHAGAAAGAHHWPQHVRVGQRHADAELQAAARAHRACLEGGDRPGEGLRLYRLRADPHHRLPLELPAVDGACAGGQHDHRCRASASLRG